MTPKIIFEISICTKHFHHQIQNRPCFCLAKKNIVFSHIPKCVKHILCLVFKLLPQWTISILILTIWNTAEINKSNMITKRFSQGKVEMKPSWEFSSIKKLQVLAPSAKALANRKPEGQMELPMRYVGLGELNFCRCHLKIRRGVIPGFPCRVSYRLCLKRIRRIIHSAHMYIFSIFIMYIYIYVYSI